MCCVPGGERSPQGEVRTAVRLMDAVVDYQPGDGWRYIVLVSDLPHDGFQGGGSNVDYAVVTVWVPGEKFGRTYVLARTGLLTERYVAEKYGLLRDADHVTAAIRQALGRT